MSTMSLRKAFKSVFCEKKRDDVVTRNLELSTVTTDELVGRANTTTKALKIG